MQDDALKPIQPLEKEPFSTQIPAKPKRRSFSSEYKLKILQELEDCHGKRGEVGKVLRREGLYASQVAQWRRALKDGLSVPFKEKKRGRKPDPTRALRQKNAKLERENQQLKKKLHQAQVPICQDRVGQVMKCN